MSSALTTLTDAGARVTCCWNFEAVDVSSTSNNCSMESFDTSGDCDCAQAADGIRPIHARASASDRKVWIDMRAATLLGPEQCRPGAIDAHGRLRINTWKGVGFRHA